MPRILLPLIAAVISCLILTYTNLFTSAISPHFLDIKYTSLNSATQKEVKCLAENIYFESAYEPDQGKIAVAFVTLNRTRHKDFPSSVCEVVTQKTKNTCQFSWFCLIKDKTPRNDEIFSKILFPILTPAVLTGFALAFARAVGEYGSVIFIAGNIPMVSEITPLLIITKLEQYDYAGATAIALTMLIFSVILLLIIQ